VLQRSLHHGPTRGGTDEALRYRAQYVFTLALYEQWFGAPPARWWPGTQARFTPARPLLRVDTARHFVLPKPRWRHAGAAAAASLSAALVAREALALPPNPLDWTATPFLQLYAALMLISLLAAIWIRRVSRDSGSGRGERLGPYELAYLANGPQRCVDAAVAQMLGDGALRWDETSKALKLDVSASTLEAPLDAVARCVAADGKPDQVLRRAARALAPLRASLEARGLLLDVGAAWRVRCFSAAPLLLVCAFGVAKMLVGASRGKPIGFLVILSILLGLIALGFLISRPTRTRAGDFAVSEATTKHARALRAPRNSELGLAVALLGTAALSGTAYAAYHQARTPPPSSSDGGSSDSSDSSSDGGGGGGCGGCGGGD
jgi:uncharacterized protein (TIGR04222 family)